MVWLVQCTRTSPCAHARSMARRLALLLLLAGTAAAGPVSSSSASADDSFDPFLLLDDESYEPTPPTRYRTTASAKVILRTDNKKDNKNKMFNTTIINIHSHTNFVLKKQPATVQPVQFAKPNKWLNSTSTSRLPATTSRRPTSSTRRPPKTTRRPPNTTNRRRPPNTTNRRRPPISSKRTTPRPKRKSTKPTKVPSRKKISNSNPGWIASFFQKNKKQGPKKPPKGNQTEFLSKIYNWIWKPNSSWFGGGSWFQSESKQSTTSTTTPAPITTTTGNWFQTLVASEEDDGAYAAVESNKKTAKKSLKKNYKGFQLLRAYPDAQWKVHEMLDLQEEAQGSGLMWWTAPSLNGSTDVLVPPDLLVDVKDFLSSSKIDYDVVIWDLQKAITYENPRLSKKQRLELEQLRGHPMTWRRYHRYSDILRYLEYLQHSHGDLVELIPLGRSSESLPLVVVKIALPSNETHVKSSSGKGYKKKWKLRSQMKPAVWIEGGSHAREWISPAVATWMIHTLVEGEKGSGAEYEMLNQADFYVMPVLNPDGYEHTHTHDRLWRKTRSRLSDHHEDYFVGWFPWNWGRTECVGVDPDRNWDYHWGEQDSSRDPCMDNFSGPHPFSEPETRAVSEFLAEHRGRIKVYLSLHAYSQAWLMPSSHAHAPFADDGVLMEMGKLATAALADMYGTKYQVGTASDLRQPASGMSHDWAKARAGIKYSYHVDMRDSFGPYGFLLPGSQIVSTAKEMWQAVKTIVDNLTPD